MELFYQEAVEWAQAGRRSVKIEIDGNNETGSADVCAWFFDYAIMNGTHRRPGEKVPCVADLLTERIKTLNNELEQVEKHRASLLHGDTEVLEQALL